jgi:hypothetical protein
MHRHLFGVLCFICVFLSTSSGQNPVIEPVHIAAGTVLTFHLQTRLNPTTENAIDALPKGTILRVKMLHGVDSKTDADGTPFLGEIVSTVTSGNQTIVHSEAAARGILVLLRNRSHPEGFRFELLLTGITDQGKAFDLTASQSASFFEAGSQPAASRAPSAMK